MSAFVGCRQQRTPEMYIHFAKTQSREGEFIGCARGYVAITCSVHVQHILETVVPIVVKYNTRHLVFRLCGKFSDRGQLLGAPHRAGGFYLLMFSKLLGRVLNASIGVLEVYCINRSSHYLRKLLRLIRMRFKRRLFTINIYL